MNAIERTPIRAGALVAAALLVTACGPSRPPAPSQGHIQPDEETRAAGETEQAEQAEQAEQDIPEPVTRSAPLPEPSAPEEAERYSVVVNQVPVRELLFALARDADLEIDIVGDIGGRVTMNAVDETLPRLLERISGQADIRYDLQPGYLRIAADEPYIETYTIDYVNLTRSSQSSIRTSTEVASTGSGNIGEGSGSGGRSGGDRSSTTVENSSQNQFWQTLERNLAGIIGVQPRSADQGRPDRERYLLMNRESGLVTVRATQDEHKQVERYVDRVMASARRQVLIEATVVEVELSDRYQAGVNWRFISANVDGLDITDLINDQSIQDLDPDDLDSDDLDVLEQNLTGGNLGSAPNAIATFLDGDFADGGIQATVRALETFGDVRVMSSPKIMALNNQPAILKVVDNRVYFTIDVESDTTESGIVNRTFESEINTVPVGLIMTVTPYVGQDDEVLLKTRPTVSRVLGFVEDPNPALDEADITNRVPEIQVRELESLLRVSSGQTAVIGGLMQDSLDKSRDSVPGLGNLPVIGNLFSYRDDQIEKTELIIFLQPTVVDNANLDGDMRRFRQYLRTRPTGQKDGQ